MTRLLPLLWLWFALCGGASAGPLRLADDLRRIDAWPAMTVLPDPGQQLTLADVRAAPARFEARRGAYAALGLHKEPIWLRLPLQVDASSDGRWILHIDYAVLNRVDVYLVGGDGVLRQHSVLGNLQPRDAAPLAGRTPAVELPLVPGEAAELYLRVQTQGAVVLPVTLNKFAAFHKAELNEQALQGVLAGLGVCLIAYSLMQSVVMREALYLKYAMLISGGWLFSVYQFGLGARYLWPGNQWLELHVGGLSALMATSGTFFFVEQALAPHRWRWFSQLMKGCGAFLLVSALAYALGLLHLHQVSTIVSFMGPAPAALGLPGAYVRARRGDAVGWLFLVAWAAYSTSMAVMVGLVNGSVPVSFWTLHSFQIGATLDMLLFMRVIGLHLKAMHSAAQTARRERDRFLSLAQTDPLTGLPNRRGLDATLAAAVTDSPDKLMAVYVIDLDGFKQVNDCHGHAVGDELLVAATRRIQHALRADDVVARLGGDEFVVVVNGLRDDRQAQEIGAHLLSVFEQPFVLSQARCADVGLTIGYAVAPHDGVEATSLLKSADAAMYHGKNSGKRCLRRATPVAA